MWYVGNYIYKFVLCYNPVSSCKYTLSFSKTHIQYTNFGKIMPILYILLFSVLFYSTSLKLP
jgi:hypothetical protein